MNNTGSSILQLKAGLLHQFLSLGGTSQSSGQTNSQSVLPSLAVLPSPALQISSPTQNSTTQSGSQRSNSRPEVEQPATPAVTYAYMVNLLTQRGRVTSPLGHGMIRTRSLIQ